MPSAESAPRSDRGDGDAAITGAEVDDGIAGLHIGHRQHPRHDAIGRRHVRNIKLRRNLRVSGSSAVSSKARTASDAGRRAMASDMGDPLGSARWAWVDVNVGPTAARKVLAAG